MAQVNAHEIRVAAAQLSKDDLPEIRGLIDGLPENHNFVEALQARWHAIADCMDELEAFLREGGLRPESVRFDTATRQIKVSPIPEELSDIQRRLVAAARELIGRRFAALPEVEGHDGPPN